MEYTASRWSVGTAIVICQSCPPHPIKSPENYRDLNSNLRSPVLLTANDTRVSHISVPIALAWNTRECAYYVRRSIGL